MSTRRVTGQNNHAGDLAPIHSPYGAALTAGMGQIINQPRPIQSSRHPYHGTVGGVVTAAASVVPLVAEGGYFGDLPQDQQADVVASDPWEHS
jgi:hypothetical protein